MRFLVLVISVLILSGFTLPSGSDSKDHYVLWKDLYIVPGTSTKIEFVAARQENGKEFIHAYHLIGWDHNIIVEARFRWDDSNRIIVGIWVSTCFIKNGTVCEDYVQRDDLKLEELRGFVNSIIQRRERVKNENTQ